MKRIYSWFRLNPKFKAFGFSLFINKGGLDLGIRLIWLAYNLGIHWS